VVGWTLAVVVKNGTGLAPPGPCACPVLDRNQTLDLNTTHPPSLLGEKKKEYWGTIECGQNSVNSRLLPPASAAHHQYFSGRLYLSLGKLGWLHDYEHG